MKNKIGLFGGSFDPLHYGHVNSILSVIDELELDEIRIIPAFQAPGKIPTAGPDSEAKIKMLELGLAGKSEKIQIDDRELKRGGVSYTIETLQSLMAEEGGEYWLVIGMDQFSQFEKWKDFEQILETVSLVVTTRPGYSVPRNLKGFPPGLKSFVDDFDGERALLKSGQEIVFVKLEDVDVSSSEIRRRLRQSKDIHQFVPSEIVDWIKENRYYTANESSIEDFEELAKFSIRFLIDKGGIQPLGFDLQGLERPMDFAVISSGTSHRAARALAENLVNEIRERFTVWPLSIEGIQESRWIVVDYGSLMIHIFYDYVRHEYRLEELWSRGRVIEVSPVESSNSDSSEVPS